MAKRGPGRPNSHAIIDDTVDILNGKVPPKSNPTPSPLKREREHAEENSPAAKRRVIERPVGEVPERRKSTRLSRPTATEEQRRSGDSVHQKSRDPYEVPPASPPQSSRNMKAMKRAGRPLRVINEGNNAVVADEGEEDAANTQPRRPALSTRSHDKEVGAAGRVTDGDSVLVDSQPITTGQRRQRLLTSRTNPRNKASVKPKQGPSQGRRNRSVRRNDQEERQPSPAGEHEDGVDKGKQSSTVVLRESQEWSRTDDEPLDSAEEQSDDDGSGELAPLSGTRQAFERASSLYDCKECWDRMLEVARKHVDEGNGEDRAPRIQELIEHVKNIKLAYRAVRQADGAIPKNSKSEIKNHIQAIRDTIGLIKNTKKKEDDQTIEGIYVEAIPKMVMLLKTVLVTRSVQGGLSMSSLEELKQLIDATITLCTKAKNWKPWPKMLEPNVWANTEIMIKTSLKGLREAYGIAQAELIHEEEEEVRKFEEAQIEQKRQTLAEHAAKFKAQDDEVAKRARDRKRDREQERNRRGVNGVGQLADVFDIDDLVMNDSSSAPAVAGQLSPARDVPRKLRERTEDIPAPMQLNWREEEDRCLIMALEEFTDENRYLDIDKKYGSDGGPLSRRDVDQLMQRALFYKQTMASRIEADREEVGNVDCWAFLLSVEG